MDEPAASRKAAADIVLVPWNADEEGGESLTVFCKQEGDLGPQRIAYDEVIGAFLHRSVLEEEEEPASRAEELPYEIFPGDLIEIPFCKGDRTAEEGPLALQQAHY